MALDKYTLSKNKKSGKWDLKKSGSNKPKKSFDKKSDATKAGALEKATGGNSSVRIKKMDGKIQEERTFPRAKDPKKTPG